MAIVLSQSMDSYIQFITVLILFVLVLGATAFTTRWISGYQKKQSINCNIEIVETTRISNNKYIQIIRVGETYKIIAVCKDSVTLLGEIPKEQLKDNTDVKVYNFKELLDKVIKKDSSDDSKLKG